MSSIYRSLPKTNESTAQSLQVLSFLSMLHIRRVVTIFGFRFVSFRVHGRVFGLFAGLRASQNLFGGFKSSAWIRKTVYLFTTRTIGRVEKEKTLT